MRINIILACTDCKRRNYTSIKNKKNDPDRIEMIMPGDHIEMEVKLIAPIAMEEGLRFAIREGGRTIGAGSIIKIIE